MQNNLYIIIYLININDPYATFLLNSVPKKKMKEMMIILIYPRVRVRVAELFGYQSQYIYSLKKDIPNQPRVFYCCIII